MKRRWN